MGKTVYDKVIEKLNKNYNCYLTDCYENPEYLSKVRHELFGNASRSITKSIAEHLTEFETKEPISRFVKVMNQESKFPDHNYKERKFNFLELNHFHIWQNEFIISYFLSMPRVGVVCIG